MRKINLSEKEYRAAKRANERIKSIKPDVDNLQRTIWRIKNKIKNKQIKVKEI